MAEDIKCLTESRMRAMEIIKQKMVEMKNQNEKLSKCFRFLLCANCTLLLYAHSDTFKCSLSNINLISKLIAIIKC